MVLSSFDAARDLERFYPGHRCAVEVVHFVSYIEPEVCAITPELEQSVRDKFDLKRNYIYIPNQFWQHKNHIVMVEAIECLLKEGRLCDYDFVFTGNLKDYRNPEYIDKLRKIMESDTVLSAGLSQVQSAVSQLSAATDGSLTSAQRNSGFPQSCPSAENASGGHPAPLPPPTRSVPGRTV